MIIFRPLPGPEERNTHYLISNRLAIQALSLETLRQTVDHLLNRPDALEQMKKNHRRMGHPDAASRAAEIILNH
jgi:UDP-N-acetylglucosamine:LPS N-acetylglucosamine transferase